MLLNLASIIHTPGGIVPFSFSMDFSQSEFGGAYPAQEPVLVSGQVRNEAGVLLLSAEMKTTLHCVCDRCATPFLRDYTQKVSAVLVTELCHEENEDDWTFLLQEHRFCVESGFQNAVQPRLQGPVCPVRQEPQRRSLRLQKRTRSPFGCVRAAVEG